MAEEEVKKEVKVVAHHPADTNGDGKVSVLFTWLIQKKVTRLTRQLVMHKNL